LYDFVTWCPSLREEYEYDTFENRVPRRTFGPKKEEVPRGLRKVHNEVFHDLYSLPTIIRLIKSGE
jgi:hypothetical protein